LKVNLATRLRCLKDSVKGRLERTIVPRRISMDLYRFLVYWTRNA
jgi:hypothetical protein